MSTCDITSGFTLGCRSNTGGIKNLYILSGSVDTIDTGASGEITGISGSGIFYQFELFRQTSDYTETITATPENGTIVYDQAVNAVFFKLQQSTRNQVKVLAQNPNLKIVVETNNGATDAVGKWWYLGQENGLQLLSGTGASGLQFSDLNGYALQFTGQEPNPANEVSGSTSSFDGVLAGITIS